MAATDEVLARLHDEMGALVNDAIDKLTRHAGGGETAPPSPPLRRVLLALDGSPGSQVALEWARAVAAATGAQVRVVTVLPTPVLPAYDGAGALAWWPQAAIDHERLHEEERRANGLAVAQLQEAGVDADGVVATGSAVAEIARVAKTHRSDLVVLGSHDRGALGRAMLGSVADGVKNLVDASVLVAKAPPSMRDLLVAADGSAGSKRAAALALRLGAAWGARVTVLHVVEPHVTLPRVPEPIDAAGMDRPPRVSYVVLPGRAAERIVEAARERDAGLIVVGSRGLGRLRSLVAGSVSAAVSHRAATSVLLVKGGHA